MTRTRKTSKEALEEKIEKGQKQVIRTKAAYEKAIADLQVLLDKQKELRKDELMEAVVKSSKSYEEILQFIQGTNE